jgi:hypothetical protein
VILLGDEIFAKVGAYVLGNLLISLIAGALTFTFLTHPDAPPNVTINGRYRLSAGQVTARPLAVANGAGEIDGRLRMID